MKKRREPAYRIPAPQQLSACVLPVAHTQKLLNWVFETKRESRGSQFPFLKCHRYFRILLQLGTATEQTDQLSDFPKFYTPCLPAQLNQKHEVPPGPWLPTPALEHSHPEDLRMLYSSISTSILACSSGFRYRWHRQSSRAASCQGRHGAPAPTFFEWWHLRDRFSIDYLHVTSMISCHRAGLWVN